MFGYAPPPHLWGSFLSILHAGRQQFHPTSKEPPRGVDACMFGLKERKNL